MAIQYQDGSFSETIPMEKLIERFKQEMKEGEPIKALHFGTIDDIEAEKEKQQLSERISKIEQAISDLTPVKTVLEIPTPKEVLEINNHLVKKEK